MTITDILNGYEMVVPALTLWREARSQSKEEIRAIYHVMLNRSTCYERTKSKRFPTKLSQVCLQPKQFSCHTKGDPNSTLWPSLNDPAFIRCLEVMAKPGLDPTKGSTHYHHLGAENKPYWDTPSTFQIQIGKARFCLLTE